MFITKREVASVTNIKEIAIPGSHQYFADRV